MRQQKKAGDERQQLVARIEDTSEEETKEDLPEINFSVLLAGCDELQEEDEIIAWLSNVQSIYTSETHIIDMPSDEDIGKLCEFLISIFDPSNPPIFMELLKTIQVLQRQNIGITYALQEPTFLVIASLANAAPELCEIAVDILAHCVPVMPHLTNIFFDTIFNLQFLNEGILERIIHFFHIALDQKIDNKLQRMDEVARYIINAGRTHDLRLLWEVPLILDAFWDSHFPFIEIDGAVELYNRMLSYDNEFAGCLLTTLQNLYKILRNEEHGHEIAMLMVTGGLDFGRIIGLVQHERPSIVSACMAFLTNFSFYGNECVDALVGNGLVNAIDYVMATSESEMKTNMVICFSMALNSSPEVLSELFLNPERLTAILDVFQSLDSITHVKVLESFRIAIDRLMKSGAVEAVQSLLEAIDMQGFMQELSDKAASLAEDEPEQVAIAMFTEFINEILSV